MLGTGINFGPRTTPDCKKVVERLFTPEGLFDAYRMARARLGTGDLVLRAAESDVEASDKAMFEVQTRADYLRDTKALFGRFPPLMRVTGITDLPAHSVVQLPFEDEAFWLIVHRGPKDVPIMCVIFGTPYKVTSN